MNDPVIIGVDVGNKQVKHASGFFESGLVVSDHMPAIAPSHQTDMIRYKNKYYSLSMKRIEYVKDKSTDDRFLGLTLIAIVKELQRRDLPKNTKIILGVGLPLGDMKNPGMKSRLRDLYMRNGGFYRVLCGKECYNIQIINVLVCPQGFAAITTLPHDTYNKPSSYIVDIGGYTVDIAKMRNGRVDQDNIMSLKNLGTIDLYGAIKEDADNSLDITLDEASIDDVLLGKEGHYISEECCNLIREHARLHVSKILSTLVEKKILLSSSYIIFIGGGSLLLKPWLKKESKRMGGSHFVENICSNSIGYENMVSRHYAMQASKAKA